MVGIVGGVRNYQLAFNGWQRFLSIKLPCKQVNS